MLLQCIALLLLATTHRSNAAFNRIGTFFACQQTDSCETNGGASSQATKVAASIDGNTLVYLNPSVNPIGRSVGFVNITDPNNPIKLRNVDTSDRGYLVDVAIVQGYPVVLTTKYDGTARMVSSYLVVMDFTSATIHATITIPDAIGTTMASSSDGIYMVVTSTSQDSNGIRIGAIHFLDLTAASPKSWETAVIATKPFTNDIPDPLGIAIKTVGTGKTAIVAMGENNAVVFANLTAKTITSTTPAGTAEVTKIDTTPADGLIRQDGTIANSRNPYAVTWIDERFYATADFNSRGFTIWDSRDSSVKYTSGNSLDWLLVRIGQFSLEDNNAIFPKSIVSAEFEGKTLLFLTAFYANVVVVYDVTNMNADPIFQQVLPLSTSYPDSMVAIPSRKLLVATSNIDFRSFGIRSSISIYQDSRAPAKYPYLQSVALDAATGSTGPFVPFGALTGLATWPVAATDDVSTFYTVEGKPFKQNRLFAIEVNASNPTPYIVKAITSLNDKSSILGNWLQQSKGLSAETISGYINSDLEKTVNLDATGLGMNGATKVWITVRGVSGSFPSCLLLVSTNSGTIERLIEAKSNTDTMTAVAQDDTTVVVVLGYTTVSGKKSARYGVFDALAATVTATTVTWKYFSHVLGETTSTNSGATVTVSGLAPYGKGRFLVLERDNQAGPDAKYKSVHTLDVGSFPTITNNAVLVKTLKLDILPLLAATWGSIPARMDGLAVDGKKDIWVNNNAGIGGEQQLNKFVLPTEAPTRAPLKPPSRPPTHSPTRVPTRFPTRAPTRFPTRGPTTSKPALVVQAPSAPLPAPSAPLLAPTPATDVVPMPINVAVSTPVAMAPMGTIVSVPLGAPSAPLGSFPSAVIPTPAGSVPTALVPTPVGLVPSAVIPTPTGSVPTPVGLVPTVVVVGTTPAGTVPIVVAPTRSGIAPMSAVVPTVASAPMATVPTPVTVVVPQPPQPNLKPSNKTNQPVPPVVTSPAPLPLPVAGSCRVTCRNRFWSGIAMYRVDATTGKCMQKCRRFFRKRWGYKCGKCP